MIINTGNRSLCRERATSMKYNIVNEIKLSYSRKGNSEKLVNNSFDAVDIFRHHFNTDEIDYRESFFALYLNQAHKVLGCNCNLQMRLIFQVIKWVELREQKQILP